MQSTPKVKLSDAIGAPIVSAYKAGGLGLAFLTLGASLLLAAFRWNDKGVVTYFILGVGTLLIVSTLILFYFKDLRKLINAHTTLATLIIRIYSPVTHKEHIAAEPGLSKVNGTSQKCSPCDLEVEASNGCEYAPHFTQIGFRDFE